MAASLLLALASGFGATFAGFSPTQTCLSRALPHSPRSYAHIIQDNCHVGWPTWEVLQVMRPVCYANYTYFTPCNVTYVNDTHPTVGTPHRADLEWFGHCKVYRMAVEDFDALVNAHTATWIRGVSYGTSIGFFPHSVQALLPLLNAPLLGWSIDQFVTLQFYPSPHGGRTWQWLFDHFNSHGWVSQLLPLLLDCLGVTSQLGDESFFYEYTNRQASRDHTFREAEALAREPTPGQILCFDTMIVPNNAFTKNCDRTFVDDEHSPALWSAFRHFVHLKFGIPPPSKEFQNQIRIGYLARENSRRLLNMDEVVATIGRVTGAPVKVFKFEKGLRLDMQVRIVSQFHVLVAVHGANLMNALFMHRGFGVVEIYLRNWSIPCYYGDLFRLHGVPHRKFCATAGPCGYHLDHRGAEYPRDDNSVDATALATVVLEEVEKAKRRLLLMRTSRLGTRRPRTPYHTLRWEGPGMDGLLHPERRNTMP